MAKIGWKTREQVDQEAMAEALDSLRNERNRRLRDSDWTQLPDAPLTGAERAAWVQYRNALRDLPSQAEGRGPEEVRNLPLPAPPVTVE